MRRKRRSRTGLYTRAPDLGQPRAARYPPMSVLFPGSQRTWSQASESSAKRYAARTQIACSKSSSDARARQSPRVHFAGRIVPPVGFAKLVSGRHLKSD